MVRGLEKKKKKKKKKRRKKDVSYPSHPYLAGGFCIIKFWYADLSDESGLSLVRNSLLLFSIRFSGLSFSLYVARFVSGCFCGLVTTIAIPCLRLIFFSFLFSFLLLFLLFSTTVCRLVVFPLKARANNQQNCG